MQRYSTLYIAVLVLLLVQEQVIGQDLCSITPLDSDTIFAIEDITACYNSIPTNPVWINSTLASLHQLAGLYVYTDYNAASIAPWNVNVDLHSVLSTMGTKNYSNDYEFQKELINLFNSLHDPNTRYFPPHPYQLCYAFKPFALLPKNSTGEGNAKVYLAENLFVSGENGTWSFSPADFYDWEVTHINGDEIMVYLNKYAQKSSTYKDPMVRLNALFKTNGWNVISGWSSYNLDNLPEETLSIQNDTQSINITLSYRAYCSKTWTNTADFVQQIQTPSSRKRANLAERSFGDKFLDASLMEVREVAESGKMERDLTNNDWSVIMEEKINRILQDSRLKRAKKGGASMSTLFSLEDGSLSAYLHLDAELNAIPVLKVQSFAPSADMERNWVNNITELINMMQRFNWSYIVLDISGNGGGFICEAELLAALLVKEINSIDINRPVVLWNPYASRKSDLNTLVFNNDLPYSLTGGFINKETGEEESASDFYNAESVNIEIGQARKQSTLTKFTYYPRSCQPWLKNILPSTSYWPEHIMIVSDGNVAGTAAMFVAKMKHNNRATVITYGGSTSSSAPKVASAQSAGGRIFSWGEFTKANNVTQAFETSAEATFVFNSVWAKADKKVGLPLEFQTAPFMPDNRVMTWDPLRYSDISSPEGLEAFTTLYTKALELWPIKQPIITPPIGGLPPIVLTPPVSEPIVDSPPVTPPVGIYDTPAEGLNIPAIMITVVIFIILLGCLIAFVVLKYMRGPDGWLAKRKYRLFGNQKLQENLLDDRSAAADADL